MEAAVRDRLEDSDAVAIVTTPELLQRVPVVKDLPCWSTSFWSGLRRLATGQIAMKTMASASSELEIEWVDREDGLILHYTSGSTGKPKGVLMYTTR